MFETKIEIDILLILKKKLVNRLVHLLEKICSF